MFRLAIELSMVSYVLLVVYFVSSSSPSSPTKFFFNKGFAISLTSCAAAEAISTLGRAPPLCPPFVLFFNLFLLPKYQTAFLTDCFPHILISPWRLD